jgi:hypothetical protein
MLSNHYCTGRVPFLDIGIGQETFSVDCYAIPLNSYEVYLRVAILQMVWLILWDTEFSGKFWGPHVQKDQLWLPEQSKHQH